MTRREPDPTEADRAAWHRLQRAALFTSGILLGIAIMAALGPHLA